MSASRLARALLASALALGVLGCATMQETYQDNPKAVLGSSAHRPDSDDDGLWDAYEAEAGSDPHHDETLARDECVRSTPENPGCEDAVV